MPSNNKPPVKKLKNPASSLIVDEVSLVDEPGNHRKFATIQSAGDNPPHNPKVPSMEFTEDQKALVVQMVNHQLTTQNTAHAEQVTTLQSLVTDTAKVVEEQATLITQQTEKLTTMETSLARHNAAAEARREATAVQQCSKYEALGKVEALTPVLLSLAPVDEKDTRLADLTTFLDSAVTAMETTTLAELGSSAPGSTSNALEVELQTRMTALREGSNSKYGAETHEAVVMTAVLDADEAFSDKYFSATS